MKRRPDSHAAAIAASAGRRSARISQQSVLQRIRIPEGAVIASYPIDTAEDGRESVRGTSVTASAQVIASKKIDRKVKRVPPQRWQQEAWQLRRETPELRFMGDRQARACSQVRLFIGKREALDEHPAPVTDGPAAELADMMFGNAPAVEQAIRRYAQHIIYNGESLIVLTDNGNGSLEWAPHAASEITGDAPNFKLNDGVATKNIDLSKQIIVRSWTPDPEKSALPDCPVVAIMPVARELIGLTKYVSAQIDSRLAGAGLLLVPQGIESIMSSPDQRPDDYSFADELTEYMTVPIVDRDSAASVVPFVATVPPDLVDKIKHVTFDSPLDPHMHERRQEAIRRIGLGMDSDPSVLLGMATANHWSAWAVDEAEVNLGVKPIVATACHALTQVVQPILQQMGVTDADQYVVWFDTSPLTIRPDRSKDAKELNERGVVSDETVRRETGFTDADAPGDDEHRQWLAERIILSNPSLAPALAHLVGLEDVDWSLAQGGSGSPSDDATSPASSPAEPVADTRAIPDTADNEPPADTEGPSAP